MESPSGRARIRTTMGILTVAVVPIITVIHTRMEDTMIMTITIMAITTTMTTRLTSMRQIRTCSCRLQLGIIILQHHDVEDCCSGRFQHAALMYMAAVFVNLAALDR